MTPILHPPARRLRALLAAVVLCCGGALADGPALTEAQVKAGYLFNFAKFIDWPVDALPGAQTPLVLCLVGRDSLGAALAAYEGRAVHGHPLSIRRTTPTQDLAGCHVAFLSDMDERRVGQIARSGSGTLLTVGDLDGFIDLGGAIGFVTIDDRVQFEVNLEALQRANLKASSQLLRLARNVAGAKARP